MKRLVSLAVPVLAVVLAGTLATACDILPAAATVNGTTISQAGLNQELSAYTHTQAGACLLSVEVGAGASLQVQGAGSGDTYAMQFADDILDNRIGNTLSRQLAAAKHLDITPADLATARHDLESLLDGEIASAASVASQSGGATACETPSGSTLTGAQVLAGLPASERAAQIRNQAVDEALLSDGADLSAKAVLRYYLANPTQFQADCVSVIVTDTQAHAQQYLTEINAGTPFATVAKAHSLDAQSAGSGGAIGCNQSEAQVDQALQQAAPVTVGKPIGPVQDTASGAWLLYEVTKRTLEPLSQVAGSIRQQLMESASNVSRVSSEVVAFARRSSVTVDPRYGSWKPPSVVPPVAPPARFLLAAASGAVAQPPASASLVPGASGLTGGGSGSGSGSGATSSGGGSSSGG
ncbi:MAG: peptidylprolyl isomerase [Acidimicrobiales bacterium]